MDEFLLEWGFAPLHDDPFMDRFRFPHSSALPTEFLTNPETGLRPKSMIKPSGCAKHDLRSGLPTHTVVPSVGVWDSGKWFEKLSKETQRALTMVLTKDEHNCWCVSGEQSPGNFLIRAYIVPNEVAAHHIPPHPSEWNDWDLEVGKTVSGHQPSGLGNSGQPVVKVPPAPKAPSLPFGIRFRCVECGHWFKEEGLAGHQKVCPGEEESRESDWIVMCECCHVLDLAAACKDGYPRPKPVKAEAAQENDSKPAEAGESPEVVAADG